MTGPAALRRSVASSVAPGAASADRTSTSPVSTGTVLTQRAGQEGGAQRVRTRCGPQSVVMEPRSVEEACQASGAPARMGPAVRHISGSATGLWPWNGWA